MAATRALTQSRPAQPAQPSSSSMSASLAAASSLSSPPPSSLDVSAAPSTSPSTNISLKSSPTMAPVSTNGHAATSSEFDDPFVVKPGRSPSILNSTPPSTVTPPTIDDAENWPEVGHAAALPANVNNGREKPKWVPAPEELQFEGQRNHHARPRPHNSNPRQPGEFIPGVGLRPYVNTNVTQTQPAVLSAIPDSAISVTADLNPHAAYYHPPHGPPLGVSPYHSPRPAGSPANNPYPLPPMGYQGQPGMPPPMHMSGYGTPPYPMYPPYGYGYGQTYVYWPPPGAPPPQAMSVSPMMYPQQSDGVPPPTMLARPPPPNESDAVAGYRDVGFALPPPSEINRHAQGQAQGQGEERERGRRTRELSFGSIGAGAEGTSKSPSPTRPSPMLGSVPEGAALGLDVSGGQGVVPTPMQAGIAAAYNEEKEKEQQDVTKGPPAC
uniref:Efflux pump FUB11 (Fusaric acid biosynthesis protein 11) n=1 Tax=Ganoderma boninense TaxID=34458 RepID=A0A5K1JSP3_9APHY|nr:Efflux pump FUB11 (Fusaric acid biosynthesis protein 11) [Ganoderma boninense]